MVVVRRFPVLRSPGEIRLDGWSAIVRGAGKTPGFPDGTAVLPAPPSPLDPLSANAPPRESAATMSAPMAASERLRRPWAGVRSGTVGLIGRVVSVRVPGRPRAVRWSIERRWVGA